MSLVADVFWKEPNVYDAAGVVGLVIGVFSIWVSWWLARRDIQKQLAEVADRASKAARDEVRRVADVLLHTGVGDVVRSLDLAREACGGRRWGRAAELCVQARQQLARVLGQPSATEDLHGELGAASALVADCVARLRLQPRTGAGEIPDEVTRGLDDSILALLRVEGRMTGIRPEEGHGQ